MIKKNIQNQIITIWDKYVKDNKIVLDTKGNDLEDIDYNRFEGIQSLKVIIDNFFESKTNMFEFKTEIDSFNKQNNFWGFTSIKGQMFFNLLLKTSETEAQNKKVEKLLKECIAEPKDLNDALNKIALMDKYTASIFDVAPDKRKAPNPKSVCYFLSYFWQIHDYSKWPIMYSSMITSFTDIDLWIQPQTHKEAYQLFYNLNEEIKGILSKHTSKQISNWEAEHSFWNFRKVIASPKKNEKKIRTSDVLPIQIQAQPISALKEASFNIYDYISPIIARLIDLGAETEIASSAKGSKYEKAVNEVFKQLGFDVEFLGQGSGREPDLIAKHKSDNVAFIIDAKAYANGYSLSAGDERAMREYISHYCPKLQKDGIRKIGFIIVSNSFRSDLESFINEITWNTDIKRFTLLTSDAILHLLAYKMKDQIPLKDIIEAIISLSSSISSQDVIQKFDDI